MNGQDAAPFLLPVDLYQTLYVRPEFFPTELSNDSETPPVKFPVALPLIATLLSIACLPAAVHAADAAASAAAAPLYTVKDGYKVDAQTLKGFRTWRQAACDRCHGANQEGMVGPSLVESLKVLTKDQFITTLTNGRLDKGMPSWSSNKNVMDNINQLYAYLKGRSDGAITRAHVEPME